MNSKELTVKFHEVPSCGLDFNFTNQTAELNTTLFDLLGDFPVYSAQFSLKPVESMVQLKGKISAELRHVCSRCAEEFNWQDY